MRMRSLFKRQTKWTFFRASEQLPWQMALTRASSVARWTAKISRCCQCWASSCGQHFVQHEPGRLGVAGNHAVVEPNPAIRHGRSQNKLKGGQGVRFVFLDVEEAVEPVMAKTS